MARVAPASADVVIVDAPCSGQSLVARGRDAPGCFHPATINLNANRQRRILANAATCVAREGSLLYITCTYSEKENERNLEWFLNHFADFAAVPVPALSRHQSHLSSHPCYRLWPQETWGAGGFVARLERSSGPSQPMNLAEVRPVWTSDRM